jgi:phenylalanyl-tRNA synthetase beta chain
MLVTLEWLKEYVEFDLDADQTAHLLTMVGLEVEGVGDSELGPVLDVKVTPNRGDCLSVVGLAREIIAKLAGECRPTDLWGAFRANWAYGDEDGPHDAAALASVEILDPELCPRYGARLVRGFRIAPSSEKMQKRLHVCGLRPISNIVDVTNYVLFELGQPLHAFDHDLLKEGRIIVRQARPGEFITTIDGTQCKVEPPMLMICDAENPVAVAGVMGGAESEVSAGTANLLLESAHFNPASIRRTARGLNLNTESSYRFERFVDPDGVVRALNRACRLIEQETGITPVRGVIDMYPGRPQPREIELDMARADMLLGTKVPFGEAMGYLTRLGMKAQPQGEGRIRVTVPAFRDDVRREDDVIEEIGRVHGYEHIPEELPFGRSLLGKECPETRFESAVRHRLLRLGLTEVVNYSLRAPSPLDDVKEYVGPRTPAGPELSVLRPTLMPGVAASAVHNVNRGMPDIAFFEIGRVLRKREEGHVEERRLALAFTGRRAEPNWQSGEKLPPHDFFSAKGVLEALFGACAVPIAFEPLQDPRFHPGRQAVVAADGHAIGVLGEVHPDVCEKLGLPGGALAAEVSLDAMATAARREITYAPPPRFPSVRRDMAFEIAKEVPYASIEAAAREAVGACLEELRLFDVYEGRGIAEGRHSLAVALTLRKADGTMTDEEANELRERAFAAVEGLGATRR